MRKYDDMHYAMRVTAVPQMAKFKSYLLYFKNMRENEKNSITKV